MVQRLGNQMSSITLCMIVKNEAHCIRQCLDSVRPYISHYIISDTGSTDKTKEIIKDCLHGIPGEILDHEWYDFSTNRNYVIEAANGKSDYKLFIDADDSLEITNKNWNLDLTCPVYDVKFIHASITYFRPQLVRDNVPCKYRGILHEYLELPAGITSRELQGAHIKFGANGARSRNPNKFLDDVKTFEKSGHLNERDQFYYAQSLRDVGFHQQAIFAYMKCYYNTNQWIEEKYIAALESAKMYERLNPNDSEMVENLYLKAYTAVPTRAEALHYLALYWRNRKRFDKGYVYAKLGLSIKPHQGLFVEDSCYQWKMKDEAAVSAIYCNRKDEAKKWNEELLQSKFLPKHEENRIRSNLTFC